MRQTLAIFLDAYRELNSRKLFWISLSISLAVVMALAMPVQTERGIGVFGAKLETGPVAQMLGARAISPSAFYKFIYSWFGINLWLGWGATILALISTASMIPELVSSGSIELTLAKPIGRLRLFLTKYAAGLIFVGLQATVFAVGALLVIGVRSGVWDARPLLVVPIMVVFFSFLQCISVLVGLVTRSTLMSLLAVMIIWLFIWALGSVENVFLGQVAGSEREVGRVEQQLAAVKAATAGVDQQLARIAKPPPGDAPKPETGTAPPNEDVKPTAEPAPPGASAETPDAPARPRHGDARRTTNRLLSTGQRILEAMTDQNPESLRQRREALESQRMSLESQLATSQDDLASVRKWHGWLYLAYTCLPKTGETKDLFQRWVIDKSDWEGFLKVLDQISGNDGGSQQQALNKRPLWWVLGTSFAFEALMLGIACVIFWRRDF